MHVLSELRNPLFDTPDRQRALRALQTSRLLRENNGAKAWQAVRNMIDRAVEEHNASPMSNSQSSSSYASPRGQNNSAPLEDPSNDNVRVFPAMGAIPSYSVQVSSGIYTPDPITTNPQQVQPDADLLPPMQQSMRQPMQAMQPLAYDAVQPNWDDFNLSNINNIVGDVQPMPGIVPDFDFVSIPMANMTGDANADMRRAFGVIHSTTRTNRRLFPWKETTSRRGRDEQCQVVQEQLLRDSVYRWWTAESGVERLAWAGYFCPGGDPTWLLLELARAGSDARLATHNCPAQLRLRRELRCCGKLEKQSDLRALLR
jgi:hypothetical protein